MIMVMMLRGVRPCGKYARREKESELSPLPCPPPQGRESRKDFPDKEEED